MSKPRKLESGRWQIRWFDVDGKRQSTTFATHDLARAELRRLEHAVEEDRAKRERIGSGAMTVREAYHAMVGKRRRDPSNTERRFEERGATYLRHFIMHIEQHLGDVKLCDLDDRVIGEWIDTLLAKRTARPGERNEAGRTLSASSIRSIATTLRRICKANRVPLSIALDDSLRQKRRKSRPRALQTVDDVRALLAACRDGWFRVACALACHAGLRLGEVASLRWHHVNWTDEEIAIELSWEGPLKARTYDDDEEEAARVVPLR